MGALLVCTAESGDGRTRFNAYFLQKTIENGGHLKSNGKLVSDFQLFGQKKQCFGVSVQWTF